MNARSPSSAKDLAAIYYEDRKCTTTGRIVYDSKKHPFTVVDKVRVVTGLKKNYQFVPAVSYRLGLFLILLLRSWGRHKQDVYAFMVNFLLGALSVVEDPVIRAIFNVISAPRGLWWIRVPIRDM